MEDNLLDIFSLSCGRGVQISWPPDIDEREAAEIIQWLELIERKIQRRMNANVLKAAHANALMAANGTPLQPKAPAGGKA